MSDHLAYALVVVAHVAAIAAGLLLGCLWNWHRCGRG